MASEKVKGSLFRCFGEGIEPGIIISAWAVYQLDEAGNLIRIHHACLTQLEANATKALAMEDGVAAVTVDQVAIIADVNYNGYVVGPGVAVMSSSEVTEAVRESAKAKLDPAELELLGVE